MRGFRNDKPIPLTIRHNIAILVLRFAGMIDCGHIREEEIESYAHVRVIGNEMRFSLSEAFLINENSDYRRCGVHWQPLS